MFILLFFLFFVSPAQAEQKQAFPIPLGNINDFAGMIDPSSLAEIERRVDGFQQRSGIEIVVVTIPTFEPYATLDEYANELFKSWKIGKAKEDNGILLIVAQKEKRIRIEVGYGLEEIIPDGLAGEIIRNQIRPYFKDGKYGLGIRAGVQSIVEVISSKKGIPLDRKGGKGNKSILDNPNFFDGIVLVLVLLFLISRFLFSPFSRRNGPGGFWGSGGGGFGGGFGGFGGGGGGFGGFGGGGSGGGGASGDW